MTHGKSLACAGGLIDVFDVTDDQTQAGELVPKTSAAPPVNFQARWLCVRHV